MLALMAVLIAVVAVPDFTASGPDAPKALAEIEGLIRRKFDEE